MTGDGATPSVTPTRRPSGARLLLIDDERAAWRAVRRRCARRVRARLGRHRCRWLGARLPVAPRRGDPGALLAGLGWPRGLSSAPHMVRGADHRALGA